MNFLSDFFTDKSALFLTVIVFGHITFLTVKSFLETLKANREKKRMEAQMIESEQRVRKIITDMERARKDLYKYFARKSQETKGMEQKNDRNSRSS
jgi:hypothetical protein